MTTDNGRCPDGPGHPAEPEPSSTVSAVVPNAGSVVVYETGSSYRPHASGVIASVTAKMAKLSKSTNYDRQIYRDRIIAVFDNVEDAQRLEQSLMGAYGEFARRRRAADAERAQRVSEAHDAFKETAARLVASAIEARRAAATKIDAVHESAVAESQTPNNSRTTP